MSFPFIVVSNRRIDPDPAPMRGVIHRLLVVEEIVEREEGARRMAGLLDHKVRCQQAAVRRTRTRCQKKSTMGGDGWCIHEWVSQASAFVYAKVFATMNSSLSANCYVSATRRRSNSNAGAF
jgi:hypothetical protein